MKNHTKIYLKAFGYDLNDQTLFVPSEISKYKAVDIHHIIGRGKGGQDRIENLMALTRQEHKEYGDREDLMWYLLKRHEEVLIEKGITYDKEFFLELKDRYKH